ncbi:hypothetical protein J2Z28_002960 [Paenibacillus xylanexedens]|uniref:Uncharacterized protein n=1 Tax=Paenibacillus xylanexedens TaxID=528191 RepID=A0ABS4RVJ4_PAEXY|nr:hypothetical protein [Paenibacillus xylanexedens]
MNETVLDKVNLQIIGGAYDLEAELIAIKS